MPKGIPAKGFRHTQKLDVLSIEDIERELARKVPDIISQLEKLTRQFACPHCHKPVQVIDKDVGIYLVNRALGMPKQRTELDITQTYQFNADQLDALLERHLPAIAELIAERYHVEIPLLASQNERSTKSDIIEGEYVQRQDKAEGSS